MRPLELRDPEIRFETDAGVQTQGDWALLGLFPVEGRMVELNAYVAIPASAGGCVGGPRGHCPTSYSVRSRTSTTSPASRDFRQ